MVAELIIEYQEDADILIVAKCPSYVGQDEDEIEDLVCARTNLATGEVEYIEIVFFNARLKGAEKVVLPIDATLITVDCRGLQPRSTVRPCSNPPTKATLIIRYDQPTDALTLEQHPPHPGRVQRELCEGVSAGLNSETGLIEHLEIRDFKARADRDGKIVLPIESSLRLVEPAQVPE